MVLPVSFTRTSNFLKEQLTRTLPRVYEIDVSQLWGLDPGMNFHQSIGDLPLGVEYVTAWIRENLGQVPALYDGNSDDIPIVDVHFGNQTFKAAMFALANEWNLLQIEKERVSASLNANIPNLSIITAKQDALADYFNRGEHYTALYGYPKVGIRGIFSLSDIANIDPGFTPYIKAAGAYTMSSAELFENLTSIIYAFMNRAKLTSPAQVLMKVPHRLGRRMVELYQSTGGTTIRQMLQSSDLGLGVARIDVHNELSGAELNKYVPNDSGTAFYPVNRDRIMLKAAGYNPSRHFYARRPFPPYQRSTLHYEQVVISATTGILNTEPNRVWYYDFNNAIA